MLKKQKVPQNEGLTTNYSKLFRVVYKGSLAHAELGENILESFVGGDFASDDFGEVMDAGAEVLTEEVGGKVGGEGILDTDDVVECERESLVMAGIGHHDIILLNLRNIGSLENFFF